MQCIRETRVGLGVVAAGTATGTGPIIGDRHYAEVVEEPAILDLVVLANPAECD